MTQARQYTPSAMALRTAIILFIFVVLFTGLLAAAYQWTRPAIEASLAAEKMKLINEVLPQDIYNNNLLQDAHPIPPTPELGTKTPGTLYLARQNGKPAAIVLEATAPDGYAGEIRLVMGITPEGKLTGVRVIQHKETPGLGDYIEPKKDRNKATPWITQFDSLDTSALSDKDWKVQKDGGTFTYRAGATITPRAIITATHKGVNYVTTHKETLFSQEPPQ